MTLGYDADGMGRLASATWGQPNGTSPPACFSTWGLYGFVENWNYNSAGEVTLKGYTVTEASGIPNQTGQGSFGVFYAYDNEGHTTWYSLENTHYVGGSTYTLDSMGRPVAMSETGYGTWVQNATYGPSNELKSIQFASPLLSTTDTETRTYNNRLQLLNLKTVTAANTTLINLTYAYSGASNNGQASGVSDALSGEQIVYHYDQLNRLMDGLGSEQIHRSQP